MIISALRELIEARIALKEALESPAPPAYDENLYYGIRQGALDVNSRYIIEVIDVNCDALLDELKETE